MDSLLANLLLKGVLIPFALGLCLGLLPICGRRVAAIAVGSAALVIYWLVEGLPPFPPLAVKQKLGYLFLAGGLIGLAGATLLGTKTRRFAVAIGASLIAVPWLGAARLASGDMGPLLLAFLIAALAGAGTALSMRTGRDLAPEAPFLVPAAMLLTAASGAVLSLLGAFIGMAQVLGAFAALAGGYLLVCITMLILKRPVPDLFAGGAGFAATFAVTAALLVTALLAPSADPLTLILATLTFGMPFAYEKWFAPRVPAIRLLRPFIAGTVIAIPAILAGLVAFIGSGETVS